MLRSIIGENDHTSSGSANRPNAPDTAATSRFTGSAQYSWCSSAGTASAEPPAIAAIGPTRIPSRIVVSNERSAARKFGTVTRTHTPSVSGTQIIATSKAFCRTVRNRVSSNSLNVFERASELDTAAATPNSTSSVIRISFGSICVTPLLYPRRLQLRVPHPLRSLQRVGYRAKLDRALSLKPTITFASNPPPPQSNNCEHATV